MARLFTTGFELAGAVTAIGAAQAEGFGNDQGVYGGQSADVLSGRFAYKCGFARATATQFGAFVKRAFTGVLATTYYGRAYVKFPSQGGNVWQDGSGIITFEDAGGGFAHVYVSTDQKFKLAYSVPGGVSHLQLGTQVGSAFSWSYDTWYMLELATRFGTGAVDYCEMRVDGVSIASGSSLNISDNPITQFGLGLLSNAIAAAPSYTMVAVIDDVAVNDSTGSSQTSWPGPGKVVALLPTADDASSGVNWTVNTTNVTTNRFAAVDNNPPIGVVFTSRTATSQVINQAKDTVGLYVPTLGAYSASLASGGGGISAGDTVTLVVAVASVGNSSTTSRSIGLNVGSNTGTAPTEVTLSSGGVAAAAWPTGWTYMASNPVYTPSVTLGTAPTVKLRKNASVTDAVMAASLALYVEYVPAAVKPHPVGGGGHKKTIDPGEVTVFGQAIKRGSLWMKRHAQRRLAEVL
jgi:hypothetical protein